MFFFVLLLRFKSTKQRVAHLNKLNGEPVLFLQGGWDMQSELHLESPTRE